ncbi:MAG: hypothetical protein IJQ82_13285 [Selenomonadaceae bacterium]|nr:hypothetical protein [Selenomonadaceae bacterium]
MMPDIVIFREQTPTERLIELQLDYNKHQIRHCQEEIAFANVHIKFGSPVALEIEFCHKLIEHANQRIREPTFERKSLQLKLENERRHES